MNLPILGDDTGVALSAAVGSNSGGSRDDSVAERTHYFTTAKNLLITGSNAVERLMSSYKDIVELAGHTARVANMFTVLEEASKGVYHKTVVEKKEKSEGGFEIEFKGDQPVAKGKKLLIELYTSYSPVYIGTDVIFFK